MWWTSWTKSRPAVSSHTIQRQCPSRPTNRQQAEVAASKQPTNSAATTVAAVDLGNVSPCSTSSHYPAAVPVSSPRRKKACGDSDGPPRQSLAPHTIRPVPAGSPSRKGGGERGCYGLCQIHKPTELAHSLFILFPSL